MFHGILCLLFDFPSYVDIVARSPMLQNLDEYRAYSYRESKVASLRTAKCHQGLAIIRVEERVSRL